MLTHLQLTAAYKVSRAFSWQEKVGLGIHSGPPGRQSVMARAADPLTSAEVTCAVPKAPRPLKDHQSPQTLDTVFPSQYRLAMFYKDTQWSTLSCANELFYSTQHYVCVENVSEFNDERQSTPQVELEIHPRRVEYGADVEPFDVEIKVVVLMSSLVTLMSESFLDTHQKHKDRNDHSVGPECCCWRG